MQHGLKIRENLIWGIIAAVTLGNVEPCHSATLGQVPDLAFRVGRVPPP